jgi:hypothetical protein
VTGGGVPEDEMYVLKRQICIAEHLASEFLNDCSSSILKESGYAILSIMFSYFEMIEQFMSGQSSKSQSKAFFIKGLRRVYPSCSLSDQHSLLVSPSMAQRFTSTLENWLPKSGPIFVHTSVVFGIRAVPSDPTSRVDAMRLGLTESTQRRLAHSHPQHQGPGSLGSMPRTFPDWSLPQ